ncbi:GNAT family N-acetyltransferase [Candidatus Gracilibacteria bacterium]|nr:GNAT family N-acetyltransferase [Candidatus Gracilibacteria bacterium]
MFTITPTAPAHFAQLAQHQRLCFPTITPEDWMTEEHFVAHLACFPAGQHVALDGERVIGQSSTFRISEALAFAPHTYHDITGANAFTLHDPAGAWLYGADMSVHPDYRGRGVATRLYNTRKALVRALGIRGIVGGGALPGYPAYSEQMTVEDYIGAVSAGRLIDPTLTPQLRNGFVVRGVLRGYLAGGAMGDDASLIVWEVEMGA